jgi:DNA-binding MarR family transcriptional regulator
VDGRLVNLLGVVALAASDRVASTVSEPAGCRGAHPAALVQISRYPGESIEALRRVVGVTHPAAVQIVDRLVEGGLIERRPGPDRRTVALHVTAAGDAAVTRLLERRAAALGGLLGPLDEDERARLGPLLEKVVAGLADDRPDALVACRLCDRAACTAARACPLQHTVPAT